MATSIRAIQRLPDTDATLPAESARENTAEGYTVSPTSVTVGNSGGGSGDAFSLIVGAVTAVNTDSRVGSWSYEFPATTGTAASVTLNVDASRWVAIRLYAKLTGYPSATMEWIRCNTAGISFSINLQTSGIPMLSVTPFTTLGVALTLNVWQRHELIVDMGGAPGQGTMYYRVYNADDSTVLGTIPQTYGLPLGSNPIISVRPGKASTSGNLALFRIDGLKAITARTTEIGPVASTGTGSGTWTFSGTGTGQRTPLASGSGAWTYTGAGVGDTPENPIPTATGTGTWTYSGTGTGSRTPKTQGAGTWTIAGTGTANRTPKASGSGSFGWVGAGTGKRTPEAGGTGAFTWSGTGTGKRTPKAAGSGTYTYTGAGAGETPPVGVFGTGAFTWAGAGVGYRQPEATGAGAYAYAGAGTAATEHRADGSGTWTWVGAGQGTRQPVAAGEGAWGWVGIGTGSGVEGRDLVFTGHLNTGRTIEGAVIGRTIAGHARDRVISGTVEV